MKFDHVLPSTFGIIKRDLTLHGTRVPLPFSARLSKVQMKMDMYLTIILFPCFDLVVYAPPSVLVDRFSAPCWIENLLFVKSMDLDLGAFQFGNLGLNTKLAGKEKKSGPISQLLAYLLNLVCAGAKCSNPTSQETWAFVSFGDVILH